MLQSIRARLMLGVLVMVVLLGALIYSTSVQMNGIKGTLNDLEKLQDVKTHVMAPQKDMNQFIAAMDGTVLFLELGDAGGAQESYDGSVDAEQDISSEFQYLEQNSPEAIVPMVTQAHTNWEIAMLFMKMRAEKLADEKGLELVRPSTEPTKAVDVHVDAALAAAEEDFGSLDFAQMTELGDNDETNPIELADVDIDGLDERVGEDLETERAAGDAAVKNSSNIVLFGSLAVLLGIIGVGAVLTTSISRPLSMLKAGAEKIAAGDLDYEFKNVPADEVGSVIHSVEAMSSGLKARIRNLQEVAGVVMVTGEEIGTAARSAKSAGADVDAIIEKADQLNGLVGQMMKDTSK